MSIIPKPRLVRTLSKDGSVHVTDEVINTVISTLGTIFSLVGTVILVVQAAAADKPWSVAGFAIYGFGLINTFLTSSLHHGLEGSYRMERILRLLDYIVIFLLIAGTYTPFCLVFLRTPLGWSLFASVWLLAALGMAIELKFPDLPKWFTNTLYVGMGWLGAIAAVPIWEAIGWGGVGLFIAGGVLYTVGSFLYYHEIPNPIPGKFGFHEIWHLFVIAAAACHYFVMYFFVLPL